jgi:CHAD domain-containing protein
MSYRLDLTEPLPDELRRVITEQLERAAGRLRDPDYDRAVAVHGARKAVKKARALLRLARPALPGDAVRELNAELRDAAGLLSGTRDADVMCATYDALAERYAGRLSKARFARARRALVLPAAGEGAADPAAETADRLEALVAHVDALPWDRADREALVGGIVRAHARGRAALHAARDEPTVDGLHDWRKRVKDLWYHERLLEELWPEVLPAQAKEAKRLSELLGDDHDLAVLAQRLTDGQGLLASAGVDFDELLELTARRRAELVETATQIGRRLFAEPPKAYDRRLKAYLRAATIEEPLITPS